MKIDCFLKSLKDKQKLLADKYHSLRPNGTQPGIMYDLSKVHIELVDDFPLVRPILSAKAFRYILAKFLVPILSSATINE